MAETTPENSQSENQQAELEGGAYDIIRQRLLEQGKVACQCRGDAR